MRLVSKIGCMLIGLVLVVANVSCENGGNTNWVDIGSLNVPAKAQGITYTAPGSGTYQFVITGGAYSFIAVGRNWASEVFIYRNRPIQWDPVAGNWLAMNPDAQLGDGTERSTREEAAAGGVGDSASFKLEAGEYLIFTVPDKRGFFGDNPGGISFAVQQAE